MLIFDTGDLQNILNLKIYFISLSNSDLKKGFCPDRFNDVKFAAGLLQPAIPLTFLSVNSTK